MADKKTEAVKKEKAPAKAAAAKKTAAKKTAAVVKPRAAKKTVLGRAPTQAEIAQLAYRYWTERGQPAGDDQQDWLRAEQELTRGESKKA